MQKAGSCQARLVCLRKDGSKSGYSSDSRRQWKRANERRRKERVQMRTQMVRGGKERTSKGMKEKQQKNTRDATVICSTRWWEAFEVGHWRLCLICAR